MIFLLKQKISQIRFLSDLNDLNDLNDLFGYKSKNC